MSPSSPILKYTRMESLISSLSSSTDNFIVGFNLGLCSEGIGDLSYKFNFIVSTSNAIGAYLSTFFGHLLSNNIAPRIAEFLSIAMFFILGLLDLNSWRKRKSRKNGNNRRGKDIDGFMLPIRQQTPKSAWKVAVPMTLNNLGGGFAGGIIGCSAYDMFFTAFFASFLLMMLGYFLGKAIVRKSQLYNNKSLSVHSELVSAGLLLLLAFIQVFDKWKSFEQE